MSDILRATLTILGCGTSTGVPVPRCPCAVCTSGDPKNERLRTSAYLSLPTGEGLLIDAGPDLRTQALRYQLPQVDGVFYTHAHADHILGTDDLRVFNFGREGTIPCFASSETQRTLNHFFSYIFSPNPNYQGGALAKLTLEEAHPGKSIPFGSISITPIEVFHGSLQVLGFRCGELVYLTDCKTIPEHSRAVIRGAEILIIDGLRYRDHATHFTVEEAVTFADEMAVNQTYLTHMTHDLDYHTLKAELQSRVQSPDGTRTVAPAYDGLRISFRCG
ncbi:MBL fold metallo-hydrolase [bacterium]|nr:MBL fold metallo-hydrolase [bacterium]